MATRGRKPLPTALKALEGDRGKGRRPLNKDLAGSETVGLIPITEDIEA